jgi:uncharacterized protein YciI
MQFISISRRRTEKFGPEEFEKRAPAETQRARELYASGAVRNIWSRDDIPGAVMLIEASSLEDAQSVVDSLPMAQAGMLDVQIVPIKGYRGFGP